MLTVTGISKSFGDKQLLDDVNFSLDNEVVGLIGNNGSGKTTILKILSGELLSDKGNVQKSDEVIHYLPQYPDFKELTVRDFLASKLVNPGDNYKIEIALQSLSLSEIDQNQPANNLSGG